MARVLHLLKGADAGPALDVIAQQQAAGDEVAVALLSGTRAPALPPDVRVQRVPDELDWETLLERIFEADQLITW